MTEPRSRPPMVVRRYLTNNLVFKLSSHLLCPQYYTEPSGTITSLNLPDRLYPANLDMAVCIRPDLASCGIEYK